MGVILSRDAILEANDLKREEAEVPEWGGSVFVRGLTGAERDAFEMLINAEGEQGRGRNIRARLVAFTAVDDDGNRLFSDADAEVLGRKSATALNRVFDVACRLNGIGAKEAEALAKNFDPEPSGDSISV